MFEKCARPHRTVQQALRRSAIGAVFLLLMLLSARAVYAHPQIVSAEPAPDAQLDVAPSFVHITFNESIEEAFASVQVLDTAGRAVDRGDGGRAPEDPLALRVSLPPLDPGVYTVVWQAVGRDGHLVKGYFTFTILGAPPEPTAPAPTPRSAPEPAPTGDTSETPSIPHEPGLTPPVDMLALLRSLILISAVMSVGGWIFLSAALALEDGRLAAPMRWMTASALLFLLVATLAFFTAHTITVAGSLTPDTITAIARDTRLGQALVGRMALTLLMFIGVVQFSSQWSRPVGVVIGGLILLTFSISGHAAATTQPWASIALDWVHLTAAIVWVGGLMGLTAALIRRNDDAPEPNLMRRALVRFSWLALASVAALTISGALAALSYLRNVNDLWGTDYGRTLLVKTALFVLAAGIGAYHLGLVRRAAQHAATAITAVVQRMRRSLPVEAALAIVVVGVAGVLTSLSHPGATPVQPPVVAVPTVAPASAGVIVEETAASEELAPPLIPQPFTAIQLAGDLRVALYIEPAAIGRNLVRITITDAQNQPRDVQRVRVMLRLNDRDIGERYVVAEPEQTGTYIVRNQMLGIAGVWRVQVQVRRIDADDVTADFLLPISK